MRTTNSARTNDEQKTTPPQKAKKSKAKSSKLTAEQLLEDMLAVLECLPAFSYALTSDGNYGTGPTLISAVDLVMNACMGVGSDGPYPESQFADAKIAATRRRQEIIETVTAWVEKLKQAGASFALIWQAFGETEPRVEFSEDYDPERAHESLVDLIRQEILLCCM